MPVGLGGRLEATALRDARTVRKALGMIIPHEHECICHETRKTAGTTTETYVAALALAGSMSTRGPWVIVSADGDGITISSSRCTEEPVG